MKTEDREYYESLIDVFATPGWKYFISDLQLSLETISDNAYMECPTNDEWQKRRGEIDKLSQIIAFETYIKSSYESEELVKEDLH